MKKETKKSEKMEPKGHEMREKNKKK